jgi:DNA-binding NarL/FixJ family response regulator
MPDMTGIETAQQMSAADPSVPLVLFTILEIEGIGDAAREAGIRTIISKSETWNLVSSIESVANEAQHKRFNLKLNVLWRISLFLLRTSRR